jgi:drug/metabolite transporter (DMT)-like permease
MLALSCAQARRDPNQPVLSTHSGDGRERGHMSVPEAARGAAAPLAAAPTRIAGRAQLLRAMALMLASTICFGGMHAAVRYTAETGLHPFEIAFFRNFLGIVLLLPVLGRHAFEFFSSRQIGLHVARAAANSGAMLCWFLALALTPLATATALGFTAPLFATLGAALLLGEVVRIRRISALAVGFIGALIVLQPGSAEPSLGAGLALASAGLWAVCLLIIKHMARTESGVTIAAYVAFLMTPITLVAALFVWQWPDWHQLFWLAVIAAVGTLGQVALGEAFRKADATAVMPLDFCKLIWASILGFVLFAETPALWTWIGGAAIFASTVYIAYRESRAAAVPRAPAAPIDQP